MGMDAGGSGKGPRAAINVTPLVDVVLVLLIIFIVTMPVLIREISIDVPRKLDEQTMAELLPDRQLVVELTNDGRLLVDEQETARQELAEKLKDKLERKREKVVFVSFGDAVRYGDAVGIMDVTKGVLKTVTGKADGGTIALRMKVDEAAKGGGAAPKP